MKLIGLGLELLLGLELWLVFSEQRTGTRTANGYGLPVLYTQLLLKQHNVSDSITPPLEIFQSLATLLLKEYFAILVIY